MTRFFAIFTLLVLVPVAARADSIRTWVDRDGVVHVTNVRPGKRSARATTTPDGGVKVKLGARSSGAPRPAINFDPSLTEACARYNIPVSLAKAIIAAESNFNPAALSNAGAVGLMQLLPTTAVDMYVDDAWEPRENIHGGVRYLRVLTNEFQGDLVKVIAAYNAGPDAVKKAGGVPDIAETRTYVERVLRYYQQYQQQG